LHSVAALLRVGLTQALGGMRNFLASAVVLLLSFTAAAQDRISPSEMAIGGISIGQTRNAVAANLGKPTSKTEEADYLSEHWHYPTLRVSFAFGSVEELHSSSPRACTPAGLCPGDAVSRMRTLYGAPTARLREDVRFFEYYANRSDCPCWLQVAASGSKVASIQVVCQP
jgi:hypothetical protein